MVFLSLIAFQINVILLMQMCLIMEIGSGNRTSKRALKANLLHIWPSNTADDNNGQFFAMYLMLCPSFALDCHYTLHIAIMDSQYLLIGGHRRSERLGPNIGRQGQ
jgi:hypothetical protein